MDRLSDVEVFVQVVERASFSAAADALGISRSHASRMVANLEERLGLRLLFRTTRKVQTTSSGRLFYERCAPMIAGISAAEQEVRDEGHSPAGTLRISLPAAFGLRFLQAGFTHAKASSNAGLNTWAIIFVLVVLQMATALRPIVGPTEETFLPTKKVFFVTHWFNCLDKSAR